MGKHSAPPGAPVHPIVAAALTGRITDPDVAPDQAEPPRKHRSGLGWPGTPAPDGGQGWPGNASGDGPPPQADEPSAWRRSWRRLLGLDPAA